MMSDQPGYTRIPNPLLELLPTLSDAECRVLLVIVRKTAGWQKACDVISYSQLREATGMSQQGVINGVEAAIKRGILKREPSGHNNGFCYEILADQVVNEVDHLKQSTKKTTEQSSSQRSRPQVVNEVDHLSPQVVNEVDSQKKESKERKERESGRAKRAPRTPSEEKTPAPIVTALADICKIDLKLGTKEQKLQLYSTAKDLYQAGVSAGKTHDEIADAIRYVGKHWQANHWKGKKGGPPWPKDIREHWRVAIEARGKNGHIPGDLPLVTTDTAEKKQVATPEERKRIIQARLAGK